MRLAFEGQPPTPEELTAIETALQAAYRTHSGSSPSLAIWNLAPRYPDASIEELRSLTRARRDVL